MQETIKSIIEGCIANDNKCQKTVYEQYRGYALKIVFRYIYNYNDAIDVVNDGFVKLFTHFQKFEFGKDLDNEKILMGWIRKIMVNTSIDQLRKRKMVMETGEIPEHIWNLSDKTHNSDQQILYKELIVMIKKLPPNYRVVFNLYVIDGFSHNEIAKILKISSGTSKSTLSRARAILQQSLKNMEDSKYA
jgi:RNA polymerase sigma-70 factor (ECF subfamily)